MCRRIQRGLLRDRVFTLCVCLYWQAHHGRYSPGTGHGVPGEGLVVFRGMPGTGAQAAAERARHSSAHREESRTVR